MRNSYAGRPIFKDGECARAAASEPDRGACKPASSGIGLYIRATNLLSIIGLLLVCGVVAGIVLNNHDLRNVMAGAALVLSVAMGALVFFSVWPKVMRLRAQKRQLDEVVSNLSQGLIMFDASERVVLCNQRYIEMSGLPADFVQPGRTLREILNRRQSRGGFTKDIEQYRRELLSEIGQEKNYSVTIGHNGCWHKIVNVPLAGGGWIGAHEDVTEKVEAEAAKEKQKIQFDTALENMSLGLCMYDAEQRLIVGNKSYAALYNMTEEQTKPGTSLQEILQHRRANGSLPGKDFDDFINNRISKITGTEPFQITNKMPDGRYIYVVHRPMKGGGWVATHEDITETKRREESFHLLFDVNPVPMWVFDRDSLRFLAVNEAAIALYGYSREQFLEMSLLDLRPQEEREWFLTFLRSLPDDQLSGSVGRHLKHDGGAIDFAVFSRALIYAGHRARLSAIYDLTMAKEAERELRRTQHFLDTVVEHVPLPIAVRDLSSRPDGSYGSRFTFFNRAYEELTGSSRDKLIGKTAHELFARERADLIVDSDVEALNCSEAVHVREHLVVSETKGKRLVTAKKVAIRDNDGKPQYLLTVLDDVTERKEAEQRIAQAEQFFNAIVENAPVPIVVKEAESLKHILINRAYEQFSGCSREQLIGKTAFDIFPPEHAALIAKHDNKAMQAELQKVVPYRRF